MSNVTHVRSMTHKLWRYFCKAYTREWRANPLISYQYRRLHSSTPSHVVALVDHRYVCSPKIIIIPLTTFGSSRHKGNAYCVW